MKLSSEGLVESVAPNGGLLIMSSKLQGVNAFVKLSWPRCFKPSCKRKPVRAANSAGNENRCFL